MSDVYAKSQNNNWTINCALNHLFTFCVVNNGLKYRKQYISCEGSNHA